jgi:hypothetical protein
VVFSPFSCSFQYLQVPVVFYGTMSGSSGWVYFTQGLNFYGLVALSGSSGLEIGGPVSDKAVLHDGSSLTAPVVRIMRYTRVPAMAIANVTGLSAGVSLQATLLDVSGVLNLHRASQVVSGTVSGSGILTNYGFLKFSGSAGLTMSDISLVNIDRVLFSRTLALNMDGVTLHNAVGGLWSWSASANSEVSSSGTRPSIFNDGEMRVSLSSSSYTLTLALASLTNSGTFSIERGRYTQTGTGTTFTQTSGELKLSSGTIFQAGNLGSITITGGSVSGIGTVIVALMLSGTAALMPGNPYGTLTCQASVVLGPTTVFETVAQSTSQSSLKMSGVATIALDGFLKIELFNNYVPPLSQSFTFLIHGDGNRLGSFAGFTDTGVTATIDASSTTQTDWVFQSVDCRLYKDCLSCAADAACGWCDNASEGSCHEGSLSGPDNGGLTCALFHYDQCVGCHVDTTACSGCVFS